MTTYSFGFNFRSTIGYVTDPANTIGWTAELYPTTKTIGSSSITAGWSGAMGSAADRSTSNDPRLAGTNTIAQNGTTRTFRVNLPLSGVWTIRAAFGDIFNRAGFFDILDSDGTTVLYSRSEVIVAAGTFLDASKTVRSSAAVWVSSNASQDITFSGTVAYVRLNVSTSLGNSIAHLSFFKQTAPVATITSTSVDTTAGTAVLTVSLDIVAPVGGCTINFATANGTAIAGTDYTAVSGTLTFAEGEQVKTITVPILP